MSNLSNKRKLYKKLNFNEIDNDMLFKFKKKAFAWCLFNTIFLIMSVSNFYIVVSKILDIGMSENIAITDAQLYSILGDIVLYFICTIVFLIGTIKSAIKSTKIKKEVNSRNIEKNDNKKELPDYKINISKLRSYKRVRLIDIIKTDFTLWIVIFFVASLVSYIMLDSLFTGMCFGLVFVTIPIVIFYLYKNRNFVKDGKIEELNNQKKEQDNLKSNFYERCVANKVSSLDSEQDKQRAILIAKNLNIDKAADLNAFFEEGKKLYEEKKAAEFENKRKQRLEALCQKELEEYRKLSEYAYSKGNGKTVAKLSADAERLRSAYNFTQNFSDKAPGLLLDKEMDWATAGGIASAIGGTVAGIATALDVQAKNAEIRAKNQETQEMISAVSSHMMLNDSAQKLSSQLHSVEIELQEAKEKLYVQLPDEELFKYLTVGNAKINISETGAVRVSADIYMVKKLKIFDDLDAHIDGTLVCIISQNGNKVAEAPLVLPFRGIYPNSKGKIHLEGMALSGADSKLSYEFSFSGKHLYAIEN